MPPCSRHFRLFSHVKNTGRCQEHGSLASKDQYGAIHTLDVNDGTPLCRFQNNRTRSVLAACWKRDFVLAKKRTLEETCGCPRDTHPSVRKATIGETLTWPSTFLKKQQLVQCPTPAASWYGSFILVSCDLGRSLPFTL